MTELAAETVVAVWEAAREQGPLERALTLLSLDASEPRDELARLPIGERDRRLFRLREKLFGAALPLTASCPACHESSEFEVSVAELASTPVGTTLGFRLPTSLDLAQALVADDPRRALAERCADHAGPLDDEAIAALASALEGADPLAEIRFAIACAACGHESKVLLDIGELMFSELSSVARRLLAEVHALASAYGWRESDILQMSSARRRLYLQMVGYE